MKDESYRTLARELRNEIDKVKGSRFLATVAPVQTRSEASELVARVRREFHDARHHAFAWRLRDDGGASRASDDGEPSGSAGRPILLELESRELRDAIAIVTRWFGGTKLGVGGLARAFGAAAATALDLAEVRVVTLTRRVELAYPYECSKAVQGLLAEWGVSPGEATYEADVRVAVDVPVGRVERFLAEFTDRTRGRGRCSG